VEGADGPLQGRLVTGHSIILKNPNAPEDWILDRFPPPPTPGLTAWDFMANVLEQGATTILATAPLTNIARFLQAYPALAGRISRIVNMGGWYHTANGRSEFNIMVDPHAAEIVLKAGIPMLLVPLEMTMQALLQRDETEGWRQMGECGRLYYEGTLNWLYHLRKLHGQEGCHLHDPLAAGLLIQPDLCESVGIVPEVNLSNGVTRIAALDESSPVRLVTDFDREGFKRLYLAAMEESFKGSTLLSSPRAE
jgi:inosine-uridine nucleoside N-ribohydrolase